MSQKQVRELSGESQSNAIHGHGGEMVDDGLGVEGQVSQAPLKHGPKIHLWGGVLREAWRSKDLVVVVDNMVDSLDLDAVVGDGWWIGCVVVEGHLKDLEVD